MLRSCKYCGRIHDTRFDCGRKPKKIRFTSNTDAAQFRRKEVWKQTSLEIRDRDHNICQVCLALYESGQTNPYPLGLVPVSVHHIISISHDISKALERTNLITLCSYHHEMAENGEIDSVWLSALAEQQERNADAAWASSAGTPLP